METLALENGLIVDFKDSNIYRVLAFIETSDFYGYEIENGKYLFPSLVHEYDLLEKALTYEFNSWKFNSFTFEGV